jgi:long-subunit acyl-CoA synthetase (AMP-forming)
MSFVAVVEGPWNISNGFLTPTMKIKRNLLERRYERLVVEWTEQNSPVIWESATALDSAAVREAS